MIANFFNKTKPIHAIIISVLFVMYYVLAIATTENPVFSVGFILQKAGNLFLFPILFFMIRFINRKNNLSNLNSYVLLVLVILFGIFPQTMEVKQVFFAHLFLLMAFRRIYSLKTHKNSKAKIFDSAFWISVATIFYNWSVLFFPLIFVGIIVFRKQSMRNFIIAIVGLIIPIFLVFTYYFFTDSIDAFNQLFLFEYSFSFADVIMNYKLWISLLVLLVLLTVAIILINFNINSLVNTIKPSWRLVIAHLTLGVLIVIVAPIKDSAIILFLFFPSAIILANFLQIIHNKRVKEVFMISLLLLSFIPYFL